jgi:hypothetical protein
MRILVERSGRLVFVGIAIDLAAVLGLPWRAGQFLTKTFGIGRNLKAID